MKEEVVGAGAAHDILTKRMLEQAMRLTLQKMR